MKNQPSKLNKKIIITGGGSGGHVSAATAIIEEIIKQHPYSYENLLYVGSRMGMESEIEGKSHEEKVISQTPIPYINIRAGKLQRYFSVVTIKRFFGVFGGVVDSWKVLKNFNPDLIISTGGYVTVPICFVAWLMRIPVYIHEQTSAVGLTNKTTGKFAKRVYISFPQSAKYFKEEKTLHVGNAIRKSIFETNGTGPTAAAIKNMVSHSSQKPLLLFTGGGQGSHVLNMNVSEIIPSLIKDFNVVIQAGDNKVYNDYDLFMNERDKLPEELRYSFFPTKYIAAEEIGYVFSKTHLHIGRSGANFVYEMGTLKIPSIFIPLPFATHNEQYKNAETLVNLGLAKIIPENLLTPSHLLKEIQTYSSEIKLGINYSESAVDKTFPTDAVVRIVNDLQLN